MSEILITNTWRDKLDALAGRRRDVLLLVILVAVVAVVAIVLWSRGSAPSIAPPATVPEEFASPAPANGVAPSPASSSLLVHVAGAVRRPGLYEMPPDARVADAVTAAHGPSPAADLDSLNLAEPLVDGIKVEVPRKGQEPVTSTLPGLPSPAPSAGSMVNLNTADQMALETIPEVGPVTAAAILEYREQVGSFTSIEELLEVSGVGPATLEAMRPFVTL